MVLASHCLALQIQKWPKTLILSVSTPFFTKTRYNEKFLKDSCSARKMPSETPGAILFAQKISKFAELRYVSCDRHNVIVTLFIILISNLYS